MIHILSKGHLASIWPNSRSELAKEGKEPTIPKKQIYANMYLESDHVLFEQAWSEMKR